MIKTFKNARKKRKIEKFLGSFLSPLILFLGLRIIEPFDVNKYRGFRRKAWNFYFYLTGVTLADTSILSLH